MFERFDGAARQAVTSARDEAARAGQQQIGPEHLLVALAGGTGIAAEALAGAGAGADALRALLPLGEAARLAPLDAEGLALIGIDLDTVSRAADAAFGAGALTRDRAARSRVRRMPFSRAARQAIELSVRSAVRLGQNQITSGHVLLGVLDQPASPAVAMLADAGADVPGLRRTVQLRLARGGPAAATG
jgi:ATP-dependent Clp protease ATP-binding subunit ClpA